MMHHQEKAAEEYPLALLYQKYAQVVLSYLERENSPDRVPAIWKSQWPYLATRN